MSVEVIVLTEQLQSPKDLAIAYLLTTRGCVKAIPPIRNRFLQPV